MSQKETHALTHALKAEAQRLGFTLAGITTPAPPENYPIYQDWVDAGRHGAMGYLATDRNLHRRQDPRHILPECRSILVLGIPYDKPTSSAKTAPETPHGRVAAYAWNNDYHDTLKPRLQALVNFLETEIGETIPNRWYTDTGPILERELGQRAGLGWIGKNSMLINPKQGSSFILAEILLGIDLTPDPPMRTDHCGNCTRCIEACPTQCILPNRTLDAQRCIAYFTIELKGAMPPDLRPKAKEWIFGCDICQQVCPWNMRFAPAKGHDDFSPRANLPAVDLIQELALTQAEFSAKFKGSPLKRSKRRGYLRNVAVALGNAQDPAAIPALSAALLQDPEPLVRQHAAWALSQLHPLASGSQAIDVLQTALTEETDETVLEEIKNSLATIL